MESQPRFLQGVYSFEGRGLLKPFLLDDELAYVVLEWVAGATLLDMLADGLRL